MRINVYLQNRHRISLNGIDVSGFAEGDYLSIKADGNSVVRVQGHAGPILNRVPQQGGQITVNLLPTSKALGKFIGLKDTLKDKLFSFVCVDGVEGLIMANGCGFGDLPQFSTGGSQAKERSFIIECSLLKLDNTAVEPLKSGFLGGLI